MNRLELDDGSYVDVIKSKTRVPGLCYEGELYPGFKDVFHKKPPIDETRNIFIYTRNNNEMQKRYPKIQEQSVDELLEMMDPIADEEGTVTHLGPDYQDVIDLLRRTKHVGDEVVLKKDKKRMSRYQWLQKGVRYTKPQQLSEQQIKEYIHAVYWENVGTEEQKDVASRIIHYYRVTGHKPCLRRPYKRKSK